jgi:hypothetical protein
MAHRPRVLFIFLDGVGIGPPDARINPFLTADLPNLAGLLGGDIPVLEEGLTHASGSSAGPDLGPRHQASAPTANPVSGPTAVAFPLDPLMGMSGLPQSGTGQVALFTGENAAALYGRHFGPWVPVPLRPLLMERSILARARAQGVSCAFANAYPSQFVHRAYTKRPAGPPLAAHGAGLLTRDEKDLAKGAAVSSEILNTAWRTRLGLTEIPEVTPEGAGENLARIVGEMGLTFFAHYSTDTAGHQKNMGAAVAALERFDAFLGGLLPELPEESLLVLSSDHGNIEDITQGHTLNPSFTLIRGPRFLERSGGLSTIMDLPDLIMDHLAPRLAM